ncbi:hypothetical protein [Blastomonas sp. AAP25]|uniref:hypothetical protein n=1 Tax=Blastomonas sp. AAP25 TaxID=1523416 RepID=UPI000AB584F6|nr:hypothetical protein [Blastomonas sp. AAP25]
MAYSIEQWRKAITKLLELTSEDKLIWQSSDDYEPEASEAIDGSFSAKLKDKMYVVSKVRRRHYLDENDFVWVYRFNLAIFERNLFSGFEAIANSPDISSIAALYEAAESNFAYNKNALGDLLD